MHSFLKQCTTTVGKVERQIFSVKYYELDFYTDVANAMI